MIQLCFLWLLPLKLGLPSSFELCIKWITFYILNIKKLVTEIFELKETKGRIFSKKKSN